MSIHNFKQMDSKGGALVNRIERPKLQSVWSMFMELGFGAPVFTAGFGATNFSFKDSILIDKIVCSAYANDGAGNVRVLVTMVQFDFNQMFGAQPPEILNVPLGTFPDQNFDRRFLFSDGFNVIEGIGLYLPSGMNIPQMNVVSYGSFGVADTYRLFLDIYYSSTDL